MDHFTCLGTMVNTGDASPDALERIVDAATAAGTLPLEGAATEGSNFLFVLAKSVDFAIIFLILT